MGVLRVTPAAVALVGLFVAIRDILSGRCRELI
jgi:hypothetical protein